MAEPADELFFHDVLQGETQHGLDREVAPLRLLSAFKATDWAADTSGPPGTAQPQSTIQHSLVSYQLSATTLN